VFAPEFFKLACSLARKTCAISLPQALDLICFSHFLTESNWPFRQIRFGDCLVHANPTPASWNRAVGPERGWLASPWGVFAGRLPSGGFTSCITQVLLALLSVEAMDRISGYRASFQTGASMACQRGRPTGQPAGNRWVSARQIKRMKVRERKERLRLARLVQRSI
jgi:hypothetical protein